MRYILLAIALTLLMAPPASGAMKVEKYERTATEPETMEVRRQGSKFIYKYNLDGTKSAKVTLTIKMGGKECKSDDIALKALLGGKDARGNSTNQWNVAHTFPEGCVAEVSAIVTSDPDDMRFVKGGCFDMGDTFGDGDPDELPAHKVCLNDFYMDTYEVTQERFKSVMGDNPTYFDRECMNCPVDNVTWFKATEYCQAVGKRLPTEAEWEYAARDRGRKQKWAGTSEEKSLKKFSRYLVNTKEKVQPVGTRQPNALGIYDLSGNIWEWTNDWYEFSYYETSERDNPQGPAAGEYRVVRGGAWNYQKMLVRTSHRNRLRPEKTDSGRGFRCVMTP